MLEQALAVPRDPVISTSTQLIAMTQNRLRIDGRHHPKPLPGYLPPYLEVVCPPLSRVLAALKAAFKEVGYNVRLEV